MNDLVRDGFSIMAKPAGPDCNLSCAYCFYRPKKRLFRQPHPRMRRPVLERFVKSYMKLHPGPRVPFAWQGGEPLLAGLDFFEAAVRLQRRHAPPGKTAHNALQTNATLLDRDFARFFAQSGFLLGISLDGPAACHDAYRRRRDGGPTHGAVMAGLELARSHGLAFNILCAVHAANQDRPEEVYRFLRDTAGATHIQFIPIVGCGEAAGAGPGGAGRVGPDGAGGPNPDGAGGVNPDGAGWVGPGSAGGLSPDGAGGSNPDGAGGLGPASVDAAAFGAFLATVWDLWRREDVGRVFVGHFDAALAAHLGQPGGLCAMARDCGRALVLEHDGSLYACDHFVDADHCAGSLARTPLATLLASPALAAFGRAKAGGLPEPCRACDMVVACGGGCPKDRFAAGPGRPAGQYLCPGLRAFLTHAAPELAAMAAVIRQQPAFRLVTA
ncbi:MAG: anaerobic sulfatase maturase [Solidesulfovibrio sp. DCME]|uniref:anaerobic sulfatase maturase n=1 Tax=Solidesulfovibrio sp. DCME TaxID=3447380 RepID=UPI003D15012E